MDAKHEKQDGTRTKRQSRKKYFEVKRNKKVITIKISDIVISIYNTTTIIK